jgi:pyruvyl transferase EpsI
MLDRDIALLSSKNKVSIVAREKVTYDFLKQNFKCNVMLTPDIVLSSKYNSNYNKRSDIGLLCLRNDIEKKLTDQDHRELNDMLSEYVSAVKFVDTQKSWKISTRDRNDALDGFIRNIQNSRIVITDRLHGMVFCAITGTPCIVFENYNHKVRGTYNWISGLQYIKLVNNIDEARRLLDTDFWRREYEYDVEKILPKYNVIIDEVRKQYYEK